MLHPATHHGSALFQAGSVGCQDRPRHQRQIAKRSGPEFDYVYYSEADQVLHTRNARFMLSVIDENTYVSPHRMQPIAHPSDMPSLATPAEGRDWLPRWSQQDLDRMERIGPVIDVDRAKNWRCCVGRSECTGDGLQGDRSTWTPWKVPIRSCRWCGMTTVSSWWPPTKGRTGSWSFAVAHWRRATRRVPLDDRVVAKPPPKKHAAARACVEIK